MDGVSVRDCNMLRVSVPPFAKLDLFPLLEFGELPPHKGVVVRVGISCDERPSPVNLHTHHHHHHNESTKVQTLGELRMCGTTN